MGKQLLRLLLQTLVLAALMPSSQSVGVWVIESLWPGNPSCSGLPQTRHSFQVGRCYQRYVFSCDAAGVTATTYAGCNGNFPVGPPIESVTYGNDVCTPNLLLGITYTCSLYTATSTASSTRSSSASATATRTAAGVFPPNCAACSVQCEVRVTCACNVPSPCRAAPTRTRTSTKSAKRSATSTASRTHTRTSTAVSTAR
jgi:hypothetical protein